MPAQVPEMSYSYGLKYFERKVTRCSKRGPSTRRQVLNILVEQYDKDGFILGYTPEYIHVKAKPETPGMPMPARGDIIP